jgi:hypothetical protein
VPEPLTLISNDLCCNAKFAITLQSLAGIVKSHIPYIPVVNITLLEIAPAIPVTENDE